MVGSVLIVVVGSMELVFSVVVWVVVGSMVVVPEGPGAGGSPAVQASHKLAEDMKNTDHTRFCCFIITFRSRKGFRQLRPGGDAAGSDAVILKGFGRECNE